MKTCPSCERELLELEFGHDKHRKNGLRPYCKECERKKSKEIYQRNLENNRQRRKLYAAQHSAEAKILSRKHYEINRDKIIERSKAYHKINPERWKKYQKEWLKNNPDKRRATMRRWRAKYPEVWHQHMANQKANRRGAAGKVSPKEWQLIKEIFDFTCPSCGIKEPEVKLQRDHIIPVKLGGKNVFENIQPLCGKCNLKKRDTIKRFEPYRASSVKFIEPRERNL